MHSFEQWCLSKFEFDSMPRKAKSIVEEGGSTTPITRPPRHTSSKYDFVKVRVWLGENSDHYYVLSRFLVSRMLTVTKISNHVAIKIALELKKLLIDNSLLDVSQSDLEANLFKLMERRGYGPEYIKRYKMMTRFHHQRIPLIILVCGAPCVGKSTIATQLAQRLNLPNVLQTDMVYELLRTATDAPLASTPIWAREFSSPEELITEFCRECCIIRKGLDGDLTKAIKDGKPVIIEGVHLDPSIYLMDEESETGPALQKKANLAPVESTLFALSLTEARSPVISETEPSGALESSIEDEGAGHHPGKEETLPNKQGNIVDVEATNTFACTTTSREEVPATSESILGTKREQGQDIEIKPASKPPTRVIVVPIVLRMDKIDHQTLLEEWITCRSADGPDLLEDTGALMSKLRIIQDYLCSFESQGMKVVDISATTFPQTLDWLHSYLLQCIERGCATSSPRTGT